MPYVRYWSKNRKTECEKRMPTMGKYCYLISILNTLISHVVTFFQFLPFGCWQIIMFGILLLENMLKNYAKNVSALEKVCEKFIRAIKFTTDCHLNYFMEFFPNQLICQIFPGHIIQTCPIIFILSLNFWFP